MRVIIGHEYATQVIPLIDAARQSIDIIVYDWRWYHRQPRHSVQRFNMAIARAARRGVKVRAVVNSPDILRELKSIGVEARRVRHKKLLHVKYLAIDKKLAVIGSHNYTQSGFNTNFEMSVIVKLPPGGGRCVEFFENVWGL